MDAGLKELQNEIASAIAGLSAEQLSWRLPGKWCVAEILEHLYLTYKATTDAFSRVAEAGRSQAPAPTWRQRWTAWLVVGLGYMPSGLEAPAVARPRGLSQEQVLTEIGPEIAEMDEIISRCEERLGRGKIRDHPILGPLTPAQWRKLHVVHGRHHLKQIRKLRRRRSTGGEAQI